MKSKQRAHGHLKARERVGRFGGGDGRRSGTSATGCLLLKGLQQKREHKTFFF